MPSALSGFHPLFEGPARADQRDPRAVVQDLTARLGTYWAKRPPQKPLLLLTQGDPFEPQGRPDSRGGRFHNHSQGLAFLPRT